VVANPHGIPMGIPLVPECRNLHVHTAIEQFHGARPEHTCKS
jgi:hypothetical protein